MIIGYTEIKCPQCGEIVLCDEMDCSCVFGKCENCGLDVEIEKNCKNK